MTETETIYRQEMLRQIFRSLQAGDSCVVVGIASIGKTRLIDCMTRPSVQATYLGDRPDAPLLLRVDCNRLAEVSDWGLYELLLTTLVEGCGERPRYENMRAQLNALRAEAITSRSAHLALRHLELALRIAIRENDLRLCFLLDEFDEAYQSLPELALDNLRALRDAHKYRLCYVLFLRQPPSRLRDLAESESFYELFSRSVLGLTPYNSADAGQIVRRLEERKNVSLDAALHGRIVQLSGGHPGLILSLFGLAAADPHLLDDASMARLQNDVHVVEEFRKLWEGLDDDERQGLCHLCQGLKIPPATQQLLLLKGLVTLAGGEPAPFSPLFAGYIAGAPLLRQKQLEVNVSVRAVTVEGQIKAGLSSLEFKLIELLASEMGRVFTREEILFSLYPAEKAYESDDTRIDAIIKRVRRAIEPDPLRPRYLLTRRGQGYRLVDIPTSAPASE